MIDRTHIVIGIALLTLVFAVLDSCSGGVSLPRPVAERFPIDGIVDLPAVGIGHQKTIDILDSFGTGTAVQLRWTAANEG